MPDEFRNLEYILQIDTLVPSGPFVDHIKVLHNSNICSSFLLIIVMNLLTVATGGLFVLPIAQAYYWHFTPTTPQQCATANVQVYNLTTYDVPPMRLLLVPFGPLPLSDTSKGVYEIPFNGPDPYTKDFQVKYPAGTQFAHLVNAISLPLITLWRPLPLYKQRVLCLRRHILSP